MDYFTHLPLDSVELQHGGVHGLPMDSVELQHAGVHGFLLDSVELQHEGVHGLPLDSVELQHAGVYSFPLDSVELQHGGVYSFPLDSVELQHVGVYVDSSDTLMHGSTHKHTVVCNEMDLETVFFAAEEYAGTLGTAETHSVPWTHSEERAPWISGASLETREDNTHLDAGKRSSDRARAWECCTQNMPVYDVPGGDTLASTVQRCGARARGEPPSCDVELVQGPYQGVYSVLVCADSEMYGATKAAIPFHTISYTMDYSLETPEAPPILGKVAACVLDS